ncbi:MAG: TrmH family RNA methyltransferase [Planctomycetota bacterium]|nr:TrmH family RNA methyltransferase [Planctomycetota bacterium]
MPVAWTGGWAGAGAANTPATTMTVPSQAARRDNPPHAPTVDTARRSTMATSRFVHLRHKPPDTFAVPRELIVACAPMRSHVNLSHIVRTCGCFGISRVIACGAARLDDKIARDGADSVVLEVHRSLGPVLDRLKREGWQLVGLEQTTGSEPLFTFPFLSRTVLVIGNERLGLEEEILERLDRVAEIPMAGLPHSLNAATSTAVAVYEYCRQFPAGGGPPRLPPPS